MKSLTINARIALAMAFVGTLMVAVGILGMFGMAQSNRAQRDAYTVHFAAVVALGKSGTALSRARFGLDWATASALADQAHTLNELTARFKVTETRR